MSMFLPYWWRVRRSVSRRCCSSTLAIIISRYSCGRLAISQRMRMFWMPCMLFSVNTLYGRAHGLASFGCLLWRSSMASRFLLYRASRSLSFQTISFAFFIVSVLSWCRGFPLRILLVNVYHAVSRERSSVSERMKATDFSNHIVTHQCISSTNKAWTA